MSRVIEYAHTPQAGVTSIISVGELPLGDESTAGDALVRAVVTGLVVRYAGPAVTRRKGSARWFWAGFGLSLLLRAL